MGTEPRGSQSQITTRLFYGDFREVFWHTEAARLSLMRRPSILVLVLVTRFVTGVQFYSHLPLVGETYVRHIKGRLRRSPDPEYIYHVPDNYHVRNRRQPPGSAQVPDVNAGNNITEAAAKVISVTYDLHKQFKFPEKMTFTFNVKGEKMKLNLKLNRKQLAHTPVSLIRDGKFVKYDSKAARDYAFYQMQDADVMVRCQNLKPPCYLVGKFTHNGKGYSIEPKDHTPKLRHKVLHNVRSMPFDVVEDNRHDTRLVSDFKYILPSDKAADEIYRERKQETEQIQYEVELEIVVDYTLYKYWEDIRGGDFEATVDTIQLYYEIMVNGVDTMYRSARTNTMAISVVPNEILIATKADDSPWIQQTYFEDNGVQLVNIDKGLDICQQWVYKQTFDNTFDAITFFTREDLAEILPDKVERDTTGLAGLLIYDETTYSLLCLDSESAVSLVEDGLFNCATRSTAHELAHCMGVLHDDEVTGCETYTSYLMATSSQPVVPYAEARNPYAFSPCSIAALETTLTRNYLDLSIPRCLNEKLSTTILKNDQPLTSPQLGEILTLDAQCVLRYGPDSSVCLDMGTDEHTVVCNNGIRCVVAGPDCDVYGRIAAFLGSTCDTDKWCDRGICVTKPTPNGTDPYDPSVPVAEVESYPPGSVDYNTQCFSQSWLNRTVIGYETGLEAAYPGYDFTCMHDECSGVMCGGLCVLPDVCQ